MPDFEIYKRKTTKTCNFNKHLNCFEPTSKEKEITGVCLKLDWAFREFGACSFWKKKCRMELVQTRGYCGRNNDRILWVTCLNFIELKQGLALVFLVFLNNQFSQQKSKTDYILSTC